MGSGSNGDGLLAYAASKNSVEGTACALRDELKPYGVSVVTLDSTGVPAEALYKSPIPFSKNANIKTTCDASLILIYVQQLFPILKEYQHNTQQKY